LSDIAIKIENLSKQYRLGQIGTGTLSHDLNRWFAKIRGKEDPTLKIGQTNRLDTGDGEYVRTLKDTVFKKGKIIMMFFI
jgi:lipopolysaccharide transport system ATP-binding protein